LLKVHVNSTPATAPIATPVHRTQAGSGTDDHAIDVGSMTNAMTPSIVATPSGRRVRQNKGALLSAIELLARGLRPHAPVNADRHQDKQARAKDYAKRVVVSHPQFLPAWSTFVMGAVAGRFQAQVTVLCWPMRWR
jgi:hypothetical protein